MGSGAAACLLAIALACSPRPERAEECEPVARVGAETVCRSDVAAPVAFRIHRHELDVYSLLKGETERLVDARLLARAAAAAGISPESLLEREMSRGVEPVTEQEIERYLDENPSAAAGGERARTRIRQYLSETRRIERRLAYLERLRREAGYELLLKPPSPPRTILDVTGAPARGPVDAPVTIVHFAAFRSRHSSRSVRNLEKLQREAALPFRWVHRNFLMRPDEIGLRAAQLGVLAQEAGRFWEFHDRLFALEGSFDDATLTAVALEVGLEPERVGSAHADEELLRRVRVDIEAARRAGAVREPTLFINGRYFSGLFDYDKLLDLARRESNPESSPPG